MRTPAWAHHFLISSLAGRSQPSAATVFRPSTIRTSIVLAARWRTSRHRGDDGRQVVRAPRCEENTAIRPGHVDFGQRPSTRHSLPWSPGWSRTAGRNGQHVAANHRRCRSRMNRARRWAGTGDDSSGLQDLRVDARDPPPRSHRRGGRDRGGAAARAQPNRPCEKAKRVERIRAVTLPRPSQHQSAHHESGDEDESHRCRCRRVSRRRVGSLEETLASVDASGLPGPVTRTVTNGEAATAIVLAAKSADLVVVGSRGLGRFERFALGSVSRRVVHHAPCAVVVVPPPSANRTGDDRRWEPTSCPTVRSRRR